MGILQKVKSGVQTAAVAVISVGTSLSANAALDFTGIIGAVDETTVTAAISALAVIKFGPSFAKWGYAKVTSMFGR